MHHRTRTIAAAILIVSVAGLLGVQQQQQQTGFAQTQKVYFVKSWYTYTSTSPHYWFTALYYAVSYGSNGKLISWYDDYHFWYSYAGWNGPWTYWGEQDVLVCSAYSYAYPCASV